MSLDAVRQPQASEGPGFEAAAERPDAAVEDLTLGDGRALRLRRWPGRGTPLMLLHGFLDSSEGWNRLAAESGRPGVAIDLPGFGGSDPPPWPRITAYAETVREAMDRLGMERAIFVGHSFGGAVAARLAERHPARVASLVLLAPAGFGPIRIAALAGLPVVRDFVAAALPLALTNRLLCQFGYALAVTRRHLPQTELVERLASSAFRVRPGARDALAALAVLNRPDKLFSRRVSYYGPVVALWGGADLLVPAAHAHQLEQVLPQAETVIWPHVAHHPQAEAPEALAEVIESVCDGADRGSVPAGWVNGGSPNGSR